jgi:hypothetical protein
MRVLAVSLLALAGTACGSRSRSADEISPLEARKSLPTPARTLPPAVAPSDAGVVAESQPALPRMVSLDAFGEGDRIADLAAIQLADRILMAWVTYLDPKPVPSPNPTRARGTQAPSPAVSKQGASVMVRALDQAAEAVGPATVISLKAESVGGVAIAAGPGPHEDVALAWVGKDGGVGQVFVTQLSAAGEKQTQRMLTHTKGGCSDVTLAPTTGGWLVGWIDSHDGYADVNVAKVGKTLARIGAEHRISQTKGEASELHLLTRARATGDEVVVAWNEVRADAALSGIFAARLTSADLTVRGDPVRVAQAAGHAHGLDLAPLEDGVVVGWIDDAAAKRTVLLARLDPSLHLVAEPVRPSLRSDPSSIALDCDHTCRVVVPSADQGQLLLYGFAYDGRSADPPARLSVIPGASTEDVSPVLVRDWLFFAEDNLHGGGRLRRAKIVWR